MKRQVDVTLKRRTLTLVAFAALVLLCETACFGQGALGWSPTSADDPPGAPPPTKADASATTGQSGQ